MKSSRDFYLRYITVVASSVACLTLATTGRAQPHPAESDAAPSVNAPRLYDGYGNFSRKITTTSDDAQRWFNQGMQLLYGFNHDEAIRSFQQAAQFDPSCAMAWWGVAYARGVHINNPEMSEEQSRLAFEAAQQAIASLDNESEVERMLTHAVEASPWPERATSAAERLLELVPGSGHLVHMPAHVFIRTGRYNDALLANERAVSIDEAYFAIAPKPQFYNVYFLHNLHFLAYAAMMEGRATTAIETARRIELQIPADFHKAYAELTDGFTTTIYHVLIRFGRWEQILEEPAPEDWRLLSRAERHYARSVALANLRRFDECATELQQLDAVASQFTDKWKMGNNKATDVIHISRRMAEGELAFHQGDRKRAFELLREAVSLEDNLAYDEPPGWMQPVRHALGALLIVDKRYDEAELVYRDDLKRHPDNAWSLLGLQQALEQQGKTDEASQLSAAVAAAWSRADVKPPGSCYCRATAVEKQ